MNEATKELLGFDGKKSPCNVVVPKIYMEFSDRMNIHCESETAEIKDIGVM